MVTFDHVKRRKLRIKQNAESARMRGKSKVNLKSYSVEKDPKKGREKTTQGIVSFCHLKRNKKNELMSIESITKND
jgi:hypothetical protein